MEDWELIELLFPERAEAARKAEEALARASQIAENPPLLFSDLWGDESNQDAKGAGPGVVTTRPAE